MIEFIEALPSTDGKPRLKVKCSSCSIVYTMTRGNYTQHASRSPLSVCTTCNKRRGGDRKYSDEDIIKCVHSCSTWKDFKSNHKKMYDILLTRKSLREFKDNLSISGRRTHSSSLKPLRDIKQGIYYLYLNSEVVYIGKTLSPVSQRVWKHLRGSKKSPAKVFDAVQAFSIKSRSDIHILELYLINKFKPVLNIDAKSDDIMTAHIDNVDSLIEFDVYVEFI